MLLGKKKQTEEKKNGEYAFEKKQTRQMKIKRVSTHLGEKN